jgi:hypothetical protein
LILLFLFNPRVRSLRSLQQASPLCNVQSKWKVCRYLQGGAEEDELLAHLEKLKPHAP